MDNTTDQPSVEYLIDTVKALQLEVERLRAEHAMQQPEPVSEDLPYVDPDGLEPPILHTTISGLRGAWSQLSVRYDYVKDGTKCPACGGYGIRWSGWFTCEFCAAKAIIKTGQVFINDDPEYTGI